MSSYPTYEEWKLNTQEVADLLNVRFLSYL